MLFAILCYAMLCYAAAVAANAAAVAAAVAAVVSVTAALTATVLIYISCPGVKPWEILIKAPVALYLCTAQC